MKIGLFDPYMDTLGGGERYILSIASSLQDIHEVTLFWNDKDIVKKTKEKFLLDIDKVKVVPNIFNSSTKTLTRLQKTRAFDYFLYISDGSIPLLGSRHVIPIVQFPIAGLQRKDFISRLKLLNTPMILCYSNFVKEFLISTYPVPIEVLYPAVPRISLTAKKENIILSVGRFTKGNNTKNQEMLIRFFKQHKLHFQKWKLILAGSYLPEDYDYVESLKKSVVKYDVEFHTNISFSQLSRLYVRAKIYWHATGYDKDIEKHPQHAEHFGISVVEAMSAGAVPIVFNGGGLKEIVQHGKNGFVFNTEKELFDSTKLLMTNNWKFEELSKNARRRAEDFSFSEFDKKIKSIIK